VILPLTPCPQGISPVLMGPSNIGQALRAPNTDGNVHGRSRATRSSTAAKNAAVRDRNQCIVSGAEKPVEVAHLIPLTCAGNSSPTGAVFPPFLRLLHMFAGSEVRQNLVNYLGLESDDSSTPGNSRSQKKINRLENLMTLTRNIHGFWDTGIIILQPVGDPLAVFDTRNSALLTDYEVTFSFVPGHQRPSPTIGWDQTTLVQEAPLATLQLSEDEDPGLDTICLMRGIEIPPPLPAINPSNSSATQPPPLMQPSGRRNMQFQRLITGSKIRLTTSDPVKYPLPHPDLLRLHAALTRVVRCTAAAEPEIPKDYSDSDGESSTIELGWELDNEDLLPSLDTVPRPHNSMQVNPQSSPPGSSKSDAAARSVKGDISPHMLPLKRSSVWEYITSLPSPPTSSPCDQDAPGRKRQRSPSVPRSASLAGKRTGKTRVRTPSVASSGVATSGVGYL